MLLFVLISLVILRCDHGILNEIKRLERRIENLSKMCPVFYFHDSRENFWHNKCAQADFVQVARGLLQKEAQRCSSIDSQRQGL